MVGPAPVVWGGVVLGFSWWGPWVECVGGVAVGQEVSAADGALERGAAIVAESKGQLLGELSALEGRLSGIGAMWQGAGSAAFGSVMAQWREKSARIIGALDTFEENLRASQSTYVASDDAASQAMSRLQSRLG